MAPGAAPRVEAPRESLRQLGGVSLLLRRRRGTRRHELRRPDAGAGPPVAELRLGGVEDSTDPRLTAREGAWTVAATSRAWDLVAQREPGGVADAWFSGSRWRSGGDLLLPDGRAFALRRRRPLSASRVLRDDGGQVLARIHAGRGRSRGDGTVELAPESGRVPELAVVLLLGLLVVLLEDGEDPDVGFSDVLAGGH